MKLQIGDKVKLDYPNSPYNGRIGIIKGLPTPKENYYFVDIEATVHEPAFYGSSWAENKLVRQISRVYKGKQILHNWVVKFSDDQVNWHIFDPKPSQALINHSPDGFGFAYYGSGPLQLSLALILDVCGATKALLYYKKFCKDVVSKLNYGWTLSREDIIDRIQSYESKNPLIIWLSKDIS